MSGDVGRRRRWIVLALLGLAALGSAVWLAAPFDAGEGTSCDHGAFLSADDVTVRTTSRRLEDPVVGPEATLVPGVTVTAAAFEARTIRTPTPCARAAVPRFAAPAAALGLAAGAVAVEAELGVASRRRPSARPRTRRDGDLLRQVGGAVLWCAAGPWYASIAELASSLVVFGGGAVLLGLGPRERPPVRDGRERTSQAQAVLLHLLTVPASWLGVAVLLSLAATAA